MISDKQIKQAAQECWRMISRSDAQSHIEVIDGEWEVKAERIYKRFGRVAWSPWYSLVTTRGLTIVAGQRSINELVRNASRRLGV